MKPNDESQKHYSHDVWSMNIEHKDEAHSGEDLIPALTSIKFDHSDCVSQPPFVDEMFLMHLTSVIYTLLQRGN